MRVSPLPTTVIILVAMASSTPTQAELIDRFSVGEGNQTAAFHFEFLDGRSWIFDIAWTGDLSGRDAFDLLAADDTGRFSFAFEVITYSFGDFLVGVTIEDAHHFGTGTPPDYADTWHYWTADTPADVWAESAVGFNDRDLIDGARDGWVFGTFSPPSTIPAPGGLIVALAAVGRRDRRRR